MELDYWEQFMYTGRVEDYLSYKNAGSVPKTACTYEEKEAGVDLRSVNMTEELYC